MQVSSPSALPDSTVRQRTATGGVRRAQQTNRRGQTDPLAALVAVAAVCLALSGYAVFVTDLVPRLGQDRAVGGATAERVWEAIDEHGYYNSSDSLTEHISPADLPQGHSVRLTVTYVGADGRLEPVGNATLGPQGQQRAVEPPPSAERYERPVPIKLRRGDVRPGSLTVVVWS